MNSTNIKFMPHPTWLYIVGWGLFLYLFIHIHSYDAVDSPILVTAMYFINFGIHEAAHLALAFLPRIFVAAAGSISEIIFATLLLIAAIKGRSYFAAVFTGLWVMFSFTSAGLYMSDARARALPLIGPGESGEHDWYYVFSQLGWLNADTMIGGGMRTIGAVIGVASLVYGAYLIISKVTHRKSH